MKMISSLRLVALALVTLVVGPLAAAAQPVDPKVQQIQLLFVQNSTGVVTDGKTLRLKNVSPSTLFFADRPVRLAGHLHTQREFLTLWGEGPDSFAKNPPNATLSFIESNKPDLLDVVVNLRNPRLQKGDLVYDITVISGTPPKTAGAAVLFIDAFGIWRRHLRRVAIVGTAVAMTSAAAARASAPATAPVTVYAPPAQLPPPGPNAQHTQASASARLEQLKTLERDGLITQAQYAKAAQQIVDELTQ